ncbi:hypothetical protein SH2C18_19070 [Clostridium sediminicola]|uniref:hypothetical protein n=1 Tax=Clostridium sediminicola TaxID=3114879 RepID=UPI0031F22917
MKKYNGKLTEATKKISQETLSKSMCTVEKLTHPSKKVSCIGSVIGGSVGIGLILVGTTGLLLGRGLLGIGSVIAGVSTVASNAVNIKKNTGVK